jgi:hypothetical protein
MVINEAFLLAVLIPADIVIFSVLIVGIIEFRKRTYDFEKMINQQKKNR